MLQRQNLIFNFQYFSGFMWSNECAAVLMRPDNIHCPHTQKILFSNFSKRILEIIKFGLLLLNLVIHVGDFVVHYLKRCMNFV